MKKVLFYLVLSFTVISVNAEKFVPEPLPENDFTEFSNESSVLTNQGKSVKNKAHVSKKITLQSYNASRQENVEKELLDSIVTKDTSGNNLSKTEYRYNTDGKQILSANYTWNTTASGWQRTNKYEYVHGKDEYNNSTEVRTYFTWDAVNGIWKNVNKNEATFQGSTNYYKYIVNYSWDDVTGSWVPISRFEQLYDEEGCDLLQVDYNWDNEAKLWIGSMKMGYIYNEDETLILSEVSYTWGESEHRWIEKNSSNYDANGNCIMLTKYSWNAGTSSWKGESKEAYEYSFNENITIKTHYDWDNGTQDWIKVSKEESAYDIYNNRILFAFYQWNDTNAKWVGTSKETFAYDEHGNKIAENHYFWNEGGWWSETYSLVCDWDNSTGDWQFVRKTEYMYNEYGLEISFVQMRRNTSADPWIANFTWKRETSYDANNKQILQVFSDWDEGNNTWRYLDKIEFLRNDQGNITFKIRSDWNGSAWAESQRATYYYSVASGTETPAYTISLHTYPNPANDLLIVAGTTIGKNIRLTDMNGRIVGSFATEESQTKINISSMSKGVYFVDVDGETVKIVKN